MSANVKFSTVCQLEAYYIPFTIRIVCVPISSTSKAISTANKLLVGVPQPKLSRVFRLKMDQNTCFNLG